jgi:hypothetical protein
VGGNCKFKKLYLKEVNEKRIEIIYKITNVTDDLMCQWRVVVRSCVYEEFWYHIY